MFGTQRNDETHVYELIYTHKDHIFDCCVELCDADYKGRLITHAPCWVVIDDYLTIHPDLARNIVDMYGFSRAVDICREDEVEIDGLTIQELYIVLASNVLYTFYEHKRYTEKELFDLWFEQDD